MGLITRRRRDERSRRNKTAGRFRLLVLKLPDGVNLILRLKCCGVPDADELILFERSNSDSYISHTANIWGITASPASGALIIACRFRSRAPFLGSLRILKVFGSIKCFPRLAHCAAFKRRLRVGWSFISAFRLFTVKQLKCAERPLTANGVTGFQRSGRDRTRRKTSVQE